MLIAIIHWVFKKNSLDLVGNISSSKEKKWSEGVTHTLIHERLGYMYLYSLENFLLKNIVSLWLLFVIVSLKQLFKTKIKRRHMHIALAWIYHYKIC